MGQGAFERQLSRDERLKAVRLRRDAPRAEKDKFLSMVRAAVAKSRCSARLSHLVQDLETLIAAETSPPVTMYTWRDADGAVVALVLKATRYDETMRLRPNDYADVVKFACATDSDSLLRFFKDLFSFKRDKTADKKAVLTLYVDAVPGEVPTLLRMGFDPPRGTGPVQLTRADMENRLRRLQSGAAPVVTDLWPYLVARGKLQRDTPPWPWHGQSAEAEDKARAALEDGIVLKLDFK
jgi:hypothetical protein